MSKKMILVSESILQTMQELRDKGLSLKKIIDDSGLQVSSHTIAKLLKYRTIWLNSNDSLRDTLGKSLYPSFLTDKMILHNCKKWRYVGTFPFGEWEQKVLTNNK